MFKKKKLLFSLVIVCVIFVGLVAVGKVTGALTYSTAGTDANLPAIKHGDFYFMSNLRSPKLFDFVAYHHIDPMQGKLLYVHRVCGLPGDTVAIIDGNLFVNGQSADDSLDLRLMYQFPADQITTVATHFKLTGEEIPHPIDSGKAIVLLTKPEMKELTSLHIPFKRYFWGDNIITPEISAQFQQPWGLDKFGPIKVPANQYFVLGDNRYMAQDSRFLGFIKRDDLLGVILGIK
jgi:signal peptidase I